MKILGSFSKDFYSKKNNPIAVGWKIKLDRIFISSPNEGFRIERLIQIESLQPLLNTFL